jgi:hypothetical protein
MNQTNSEPDVYQTVEFQNPEKMRLKPSNSLTLDTQPVQYSQHIFKTFIYE